MRNSPFQLKQTSMLQTYDSSVAYIRHKRVIDHSRTTQASPRDYIEQVLNKRESTQRTRRFEELSRQAEADKTNIHMLNRFNEIRRGRQLSVPSADYKAHQQRSPVQQKHSLNFTKKKKYDMELVKSNLAMMRRL